MATVKELLKASENHLSGGSTGRLEGEILLAQAMRVPRAFLFAHPEYQVDSEPARDFMELVRRRTGGEPVAYITGEREFWSLPLRVTPAVLIPRPETELLVEAALARIPSDEATRIADLGTGSGAIAVALASERPRGEIHATEISPDALAVAQDNATRLRLGNVCFHLGSWFDPLSGTFDLIVSNPPYVAIGDPHLDEGDLRFEPETSLVAGPQGLEAIHAITTRAPQWLNPGGWLIFEHGHDQAAVCQALLEAEGFQEIETLSDLEGTKRITLGARNLARPL